MSATVTGHLPLSRSFPIPAPSPVISTVPFARNRRRKIGPEAGHALEKLGHAIEYLADEYAHRGGEFSPSDSDVQAMQLLMALNRQIYFDCPAVPTFAERCRSLLSCLRA